LTSDPASPGTVRLFRIREGKQGALDDAREINGLPGRKIRAAPSVMPAAIGACVFF
jgi:hypothetical protein